MENLCERKLCLHIVRPILGWLCAESSNILILYFGKHTKTTRKHMELWPTFRRGTIVHTKQRRESNTNLTTSHSDSNNLGNSERPTYPRLHVDCCGLSAVIRSQRFRIIVWFTVVRRVQFIFFHDWSEIIRTRALPQCHGVSCVRSMGNAKPNNLQFLSAIITARDFS